MFKDFRISDESRFDEFENNFELLFMNQVREDIMKRIRCLIKADIHQTFKKPTDNMSFYKDSDCKEAFALQRNQFLQEGFVIR